MKFILTLFLFISIVSRSLGQEHIAFMKQWDNTQSFIKQIDSLANRTVKSKFKLRKSKLKYFSENKGLAEHKVKIKYKNGIVKIKHTYNFGRFDKIIVLMINDKTIFIVHKVKGDVKNSFVDVGKNTWHWTYIESKDVYGNPIYAKQTIPNWL